MKYFGSKISDNMVKTPEGFLLCLGVSIGRTGAMDYAEHELEGAELEGDENGIVKITRDEDELFRPETIHSFEGKPFTITHPDELVCPQSWSRVAKGHLTNVRRGVGAMQTDLLSDLLITDAEAIELVESGQMREVSCGYEADYKQTAPGKGKQSNIAGNHLALVSQGRAGTGYAIKDHKGETKMDFKKLFGLYKNDPEAVKAMKAVTTDAKAKADDEEAPVALDEKMSAACDSLVKGIDALNAAVANMAQPTTAAKDKKAKDAAEVAAAKKGEEKVDDEGEEASDPLAKILAGIESINKRLDALEGSTDEEETEEVSDEESEEDVVVDADEENGEEVGDDGEEVAPKVISGDAAVISRAEIIAPGLDIEDGDKAIKVKALKVCHATKDGKKIVEALNGGKKPVWTDKKSVDQLFISVSEVLKAKRTRSNAKTKFADKELIDGTPESKVMTAEKMNEMNAKHYAKRGSAN